MTLHEILPYASLLLTFAAFYINRKRDAKDEAAMITKMSVKMDGIASDVSDVKADVQALRNETKADHDAIVLMKAKVDALGQRVDELKKMKGE